MPGLLQTTRNSRYQKKVDTKNSKKNFPTYGRVMQIASPILKIPNLEFFHIFFAMKPVSNY